MRWFVTALLALILIPGFALAAMLEGTVEKVDRDKKQIVLKTDMGSETVEFDSATKSVDKAKVGEKVAIMTSEKNGKRIASEINAARAGGPKSSASDRPASPGGISEKPPRGVK